MGSSAKTWVILSAVTYGLVGVATIVLNSMFVQLSSLRNQGIWLCILMLCGLRVSQNPKGCLSCLYRLHMFVTFLSWASLGITILASSFMLNGVAHDICTGQSGYNLDQHYLEIYRVFDDSCSGFASMSSCVQSGILGESDVEVSQLVFLVEQLQRKMECGAPCTEFYPLFRPSSFLPKCASKMNKLWEMFSLIGVAVTFGSIIILVAFCSIPSLRRQYEDRHICLLPQVNSHTTTVNPAPIVIVANNRHVPEESAVCSPLINREATHYHVANPEYVYASDPTPSNVYHSTAQFAPNRFIPPQGSAPQAIFQHGTHSPRNVHVVEYNVDQHMSYNPAREVANSSPRNAMYTEYYAKLPK